MPHVDTTKTTTTNNPLYFKVLIDILSNVTIKIKETKFKLNSRVHFIFPCFMNLLTSVT